MASAITGHQCSLISAWVRTDEDTCIHMHHREEGDSVCCFSEGLVRWPCWFYKQSWAFGQTVEVWVSQSPSDQEKLPKGMKRRGVYAQAPRL